MTNTFQVKNNQTIAFAPISSQIITNTLQLNATASSGLPATFTLLSGPAIPSNGTNLTFTAHGMVSVVASQGGDANNWPATPVTNSFRVNALYTLTVVSPLGTSIPGAGPNVIVEGTILTPQGLGAPTLTNGVVTQHLCLGWTMTGNAPFSGNLSSFTMTMTNNATLTWIYTTSIYFHDDFESGFGNWIHNGTWGLDTSSAVSPTHCAKSNPGGYYTNNTDTAMSMSNAIGLAGMAHPALHFWTKYDLEENYDYVYVEGSTNGGAAWFQIPGGSYTGTDLAWTEQQFDLSTWGAATAFRVRFHIVTDASVVKDGWYVDDVHIGNAPDPLSAMPATTTANSVTLNWTASNFGDFAAYRIYRSLEPGQPWQNGILVATVTGQDTTTFVDTTVGPKTHYYYQIVVVNVGQLFAFSGVIPATTTIGMDYPFLDNCEAGGGDWVADAPWTLTTDDYVSPTHSWEDSPGANYTNGIAGQSLTLSSPMNFLAAVNPVLTFSHKYALDSGSYVNIEASTNQGAGWTLLASYSGSSAGWILGRVALTNYAGQPSVLVRFRLTSSPGSTNGVWHIDNISATEALTTVNPVTLDQVGANSMRLTWPANTQGAFNYYAIFHDTNAAVGINSPLAGIVTNQNTATFTVTGLSPNTTHYFRVYAVNSYGGYSLDAPGPATTNTTLLTTPFADSFEEATPFNFALSGSWELTTETSHSGVQCLTDSPGTNYSPNADDGALMQLNLTQNQWPVLKFWDRYSVGGSGRAAVQVGGGTSMYIVSGTETAWQPEAIDLSWWAGQPNIPVYFHIKRWNNEQADGWCIDDVSVAEQVPVPLSYPFHDGFEQGLGNWLPGTWHIVTDTTEDGTNSVYNQVTDNNGLPAQQPMLSLAGWINLTNAVNPRLVFWWTGYSGYGNGLAAQVCVPGSGFSTVWDSQNAGYGSSYGWTRIQVSLQAYVNRNIRINFYTYGNPGMHLDRVIVAEQAQPVTLTNAVAGFKSVQLNWTPTASSNSFVRYEMWRGTSSGQAGLLTTVSNVNQTSLTDSNGLSATTTYYYRVYTVDTNDMYVASVNETNATTTQLSYPFSDSFNNLGQWITSGQWGLTTSTSHSGASCLTDSPNGDYSANGDDNAQTSLDLRLAQWPVLRFWDKYALTPNTRAVVQVGGGTSMYIVNGTQSVWQPEAIDLSWWVGQANVPLEFRLRRWNNEQADGWYIDDVSVAEQVPVPLSYPFHDGFEQGLGNWLPGTWHIATDTMEDGTNSVYNLVTDNNNVAAQQPMLSLGGWINLTNAVNPRLVFWWTGYSGYGNGLGVQVCTPGSGFAGVWDSQNAGYGGSYGWTRIQVSLQAYVNRNIRINFYTYGNPGIHLDQVGVGGIMPGAPTLALPPDASLVTALRPTLTVTNAVHAENFPLTYQFEVYSDAGLSNMVAQVPLVASGAGTSSWPLDINLADNARYWWRCRAWYSTNAGPWMPTATFYVNSLGLPPLQVVLSAPASASSIPDTNTLFSWYAGVDPAGDFIQFYDFQVDSDPGFGSPKVNGTVAMSGPVDPLSDVTISVSLSAYAGAKNLQPGVRYYWRVQAQDAHGMIGPWSSAWNFELAGSAPAPVPASIISFQRINGANWLLQWSGPTNNVYLEAAPSLSAAPAWSTVAGPLSGTNYTFPATNWTSGFYRLRSQ